MPVTVLTDYSVIENALVSWMETYSGLGTGNVIWLNPAAMSPAKPYASLFVLSDGLVPSEGLRFGQDEQVDEYNSVDNLLDRTSQGPREMVVQIVVYTDLVAISNGMDARYNMQNALVALETEVVKDAFRIAEFSLIDHQPVTTVDENVSGTWERRATASIRLFYMAGVKEEGTEGIGWIEDVEVPDSVNANLTINE